MTTMSQVSFAGGEIAPALHGRVDMVKRQTGLKTCRNFIVQRYGSVANRPGTQYIGEVKDSTDQARIIPFVYSADDALLLELGDYYVRFILAGAYVQVSGVAAWSGATAYALGDLAASGGVNYYCKSPHTNQAPPNASYWYPLTGTIFELPTPWAVADLPDLKYTQSADVMTVVHPSYAPQNITRLGATQWTIQPAVFNLADRYIHDTGASANVRHGTIQVTGGGSMVQTNKYKVTAIDKETGRETLAFYSNANYREINSITRANPPVVTTTANHDLQTGDEVCLHHINGAHRVGYQNAAPGWEALNGRNYIVTRISATTFSLDGIDTTGMPVAWANDPVFLTNGRMYSTWDSKAATPVEVYGQYPFNTLIPSTALLFNVYKYSNGGWFLLGTHEPGKSFTDSGSLSVDASVSVPRPNTLFMKSDGFPSTLAYYQQRRVFGASEDNPERVWASMTADYGKFIQHSPGQDDDMVQFDLTGDRVNVVRHLVDLGKLVLLTSGSEKAATAEVLTPTDISVKTYSYNGASSLAPIVIDNTALYVQARGSIVRDLAFDFASDGYKGNDLTIFSPHLFEGRQVMAWAYAKTPHSIVWAVLDDGKVLGLTYVREHQVWAWHRHDTLGFVEDVAVIPEGDEDVPYFLVRRNIGGSTKRYIERMYSRVVDEDAQEAMVFMDCALSYDGEIPIGGPYGTISIRNYDVFSGGGVQPAGTAALVRGLGDFYFDASHVGKTYLLRDAAGNRYRFTVQAYETTLATGAWSGAQSAVAYGTLDGPVAAGGSATATSWALCASTFTGLDHLNDQLVSVFADGFVVANPNVAAYPVVQVSGGSITLPEAYAVVHVGLPYTSDFENLDLDNPQQGTLADKKKLINKLTLRVEKTRGGFVGSKAPTGDTVDPTILREFKQRGADATLAPPDLLTGLIDVTVQGQWNDNGRVFIRQSDPLPISILEIHPAGFIPR